MSRFVYCRNIEITLASKCIASLNKDCLIKNANMLLLIIAPIKRNCFVSKLHNGKNSNPAQPHEGSQTNDLPARLHFRVRSTNVSTY